MDMMNEFDFANYVRINYMDSMDTLNVMNASSESFLGFKYALSELLMHYDRLACSIHNNSMVVHALANLYASLNAFRLELLVIGAKRELIDIVINESAVIFAQLVNYRRGNKVEFS